MRIGFFSPTINRVGGGEWVTLNMIHSLNATKHEVAIYSAERIDPAHIRSFFGNSIKLSQEVNFRPNVFDPFGLENIYPNLLKSFLLSLRCDLLIDTFSNDLHPWTDAVYFQGPPRIFRPCKGIRRLILLPYQTMSQGTLRHRVGQKKILMANSKWSAKTVEYFTKSPVNVLYPPVSDYFKIKVVASDRRNNRAATVIRIAEDKRPETILHIARMVAAGIEFVVVGSCKTEREMNVLCRLREAIENLGLGGKVKVLLNVSREKQKEILQTSKVYLHPFVQYESFGVSAVEAMAAGCIPVVPNIGGLKEIVPKNLRYTSVEEAASLVEASIDKWSPRAANEYADSTSRFSQTKFEAEFMRIMKL